MIKRHWWKCIGLVVSLSFFSGCQSSQPSWHCEEIHNGAHTQEYTICSDKDKYEYGENMRVRFTVTNISARPILLDGGTEPVMDILEHELSWSATQSQTLTQLALAPESSHTIEWLWIPTQAHLEDIFSKLQSRPFYTSFRGQVAGERVVGIDPYIKNLDYEPVSSSDALPGHCERGRRLVGDLELQLCTDKRDYQYGEPVQIRWQIRNISDSPIVLDGGEAAALDVFLVEWKPASAEGELPYYAEERWSSMHPYDTQIELEPGEIQLVEWQWPTSQTNLTAILEHQRIPGKDKSLVSIYGDYAFQPENRWTFYVRIGYMFEENEGN